MTRRPLPLFIVFVAAAVVRLVLIPMGPDEGGTADAFFVVGTIVSLIGLASLVLGVVALVRGRARSAG
jgi:hypothetical protein